MNTESRPRILIIKPVLPYPPDQGTKVLSFSLIRAMRPNFAVDPATGYLYCSYMKYDSSTVSEGSYEMADAVVTVSTNNGTHWAVGTNVTNTTPDMNPVPAGESMHERDVTLAKVVTEGLQMRAIGKNRQSNLFDREFCTSRMKAE